MRKTTPLLNLKALAIIEGIKKYSSYLQHSVKFLIQTDHCALKWLFAQKCVSDRLARWILKVQSYEYEVVHKRGCKNGNADALSRISYPEPCNACNSRTVTSHTSSDTELNWIQCDLERMADDVTGDPSETHQTEPKVDLVRNLRYQRNKRVTGNEEKYVHKLPSFPDEIDVDKFKEAQKVDAIAGPLLRYLDQDILPNDQRQARDILLHADQYFVHEGLLYHIWHTPAKRHMPERNTMQLYVPVTMVDLCLTTVMIMF